jgi:hypothetical protein
VKHGIIGKRMCHMGELKPAGDIVEVAAGYSGY